MLQCPRCGRSYASDKRTCPEDGATLRADPTLAVHIPLDPLIGFVLDDKYRLEDRLGEGGMGTVYRATHLLIERAVAVKVLNERLVTDAASKERFRREACAAGRLHHANAVAVTDFGETADGRVYIVMELLEGESLSAVLARESPLDATRAVSWMLQTAAAVAAAHRAGVIHRDLKPGNIFVEQHPNTQQAIKVLDFGIAKLATDTTGGNQVTTLTDVGVMIGTPRYMSPEQCGGASLTPASDVYSLGVIFYEMLTGDAPFDGSTPLALALKHSSQAPRPPREIVPTIPPMIEEVVLHALAKNPNDRPANAEELQRELFAVAVSLGLEQDAALGARVFDTPRDSANANVETSPAALQPIGVDVDRRADATAPLTTDGATPSRATSSSDATEDRAPMTGGQSSPQTFPTTPAFGEPGSTGAVAPVAVTPSPVAPHGVTVGSRMHTWLRRHDARDWRAWLRETPVRVGLLIIACAATIAVVALWRSLNNQSGASTSTGRAVAVDEDAVGRDLSSAESMPRATSVPREPRSAAEFYERGTYYFTSRDYEGAVRDFRRALELQPDFPTAHNRLGRVLMMKGQLSAAAEEFRAAIRQRGGDYPAAQYNLGFTLERQGEGEQAVAAYADAIKNRGGTYPDAFYQTGIIHLNMNRHAEAEAALRTAIEQYGGRDADAHHALGVALAQQQDHAGAEASFLAAIAERGGDFADAHYNLGLMYEKTERLDDAIKEYETYLKQQPRGANRRLVENSLRALRRRAARQGESP